MEESNSKFSEEEEQHKLSPPVQQHFSRPQYGVKQPAFRQIQQTQLEELQAKLVMKQREVALAQAQAQQQHQDYYNNQD